jgi:hypothetical protein
VLIGEHLLNAGDAFASDRADSLRIVAKDRAEILIFDLA